MLAFSWIPFNNNNRLFMAPHLVRAQSAYKHIRIHSFHHTHTLTCMRTPRHTTHTRVHTTNTCITGDGLVKRQISVQRKSLGEIFETLDTGSCRQVVHTSECLSGVGLEKNPDVGFFFLKTWIPFRQDLWNPVQWQPPWSRTLSHWFQWPWPVFKVRAQWKCIR